MSRRRFTLTGLFLLVAFCALLLAFFVPLMRRAAGDVKGANRVEGLAFSADGSTVAALFGDGKVRVWRAETQTSLATLETEVSGFGGGIAISADGTTLAVSTGISSAPASEIEIWDFAKAQKRATLTGSWDAQIAFSPTQAILAVRKLGAPIEFYDCAPGAPPAPSIVHADIAAATQAGSNTAMAFSDDGNTLAVASATGVRFWNLKGGELGASIADRFGLIGGMALSADGTKLAVSGYDLTAHGRRGQLAYLWLWDVREGRRMPDLPHSQDLHGGTAGSSNSLAFLPDDRTLVFADGNLIAWDVDTGRTRTLPADVDASAEMLAAPRRGNRFAVSNSEKIMLWDAATLAPREMLWTAPSEGLSPLLPVAAFALIVAWMMHHAKTLKRKCPACGRSFALASAKDAQTQCPACRLKSLSVEQRAKQQKQQSKQIRNIWIALAAIVLGLAVPVAASFNQRFGVQPWLLAYLLAVASIALGAPAALIGSLFAYVYLRRWWRFRERNLLRRVKSSAGPPAETLHFGPVMVWCAEGTTFGSEIERRLAACSERVKELTGLSPSPGRRLRCFVFDDRESCAKCLHALGHLPSPDADLISTYLPAPCRALFLSESELRGRLLDPLAAIEGSLACYLFESLGFSLRRPWLGVGLANVIVSRPRAERLAALNRHMLSALAAGRTLNARALLAPFPRFKINFNPIAAAEISEFAKTAAQNSQYWSLMEFLCGSGSTPARRTAFQRFLQDLRRRKRQAEALAEHFGCSPDQLLADWRQWVLDCGLGEYAPPPAEYAEILLSGPIATGKSEQASPDERSRAIRRLGREGFAIGADALIDVLRHGPSELATEAIWALETISGRPLGGDVAQWEAWRASLPDAAAVRRALVDE